MREAGITASAQTQTIIMAQQSMPGGEVQIIQINSGMVPRIVSELMLASVALGLNMDYPLPPTPKGN